MFSIWCLVFTRLFVLQCYLHSRLSFKHSIFQVVTLNSSSQMQQLNRTYICLNHALWLECFCRNFWWVHASYLYRISSHYTDSKLRYVANFHPKELCLFQFDWLSIWLDQLLTFCFFHLSCTFYTFYFFLSFTHQHHSVYSFQLSTIALHTHSCTFSLCLTSYPSVCVSFIQYSLFLVSIHIHSFFSRYLFFLQQV